MSVAASMGLEEKIIARSYTAPYVAPALARELDPLCDVLLFTGRVPFEIAQNQVPLSATALYIRYSALDLYRSLVIVALNHGGRMPRMSVDTIDRETVLESFHEVGVRPPDDLYPLSDINVLKPDLDHVFTQFHREKYRQGLAELCVTCMTSVHDELRVEGIPVIRVRTTDSSVREALSRTAMAAQLQKSENSQVAALAIAPETSQSQKLMTIEKDLANALRGRVIDDRDARVIVTTRGALERALRRPNTQKIWDALAEVPAWLGAGYGDSVPEAERNALQSKTLAISTRHHQESLPDGSIRRMKDPSSKALQLRNLDSRRQDLLEASGLSQLTISRLQAALAAIGREHVTARELAVEYGVEPRSARRLLAALQRAGIADELGTHAAAGAGRPQLVYKINLPALLEVNAPN